MHKDLTRPKLQYDASASSKAGSYYKKLRLPEQVPFSLAHFVLQRGETSKLDSHQVKEVWYVAQGEGELTYQADVKQHITAGDAVYFDSNHSHQVRNLGETDLVLCSIWWGD